MTTGNDKLEGISLIFASFESYLVDVTMNVSRTWESIHVYDRGSKGG